MKFPIRFILLMLFSPLFIFAQNTTIVKGVLLNAHTKKPLPYANIVVLHNGQGTISNEKGMFSLDLAKLSATDTISFQYIGYQTKLLLVNQLDSLSVIYLKEDIISLSEATVFANPPDPKFIVKQVLENKEKNYKKRTAKAQTFMRWRNTSDIEKASVDLKRNNIKELDEAFLKRAADKIPKHNTSYVDFLSDIYFSKNEKDTLKINPIRMVSLKAEEIAELEQIGKVFENLFVQEDEREYWKVKSGILSQKLDIEEEQKDTIAQEKSENSIETKRYKRIIENRLSYSSLDNKDYWEFLHKTSKYDYEFAGGTKVNGEEVFIIDFTPKSGGLYQGRLYISMNSYALIRADYNYAEGKIGKDIDLFGVAYKENYFSGSIYFEKEKDNYVLKYFTYKLGNYVGVERKVSLIKKRKRFLLDKKLKEIKVGLNFQVSNQESIEVLFLSNEQINYQQFLDFEQPKEMEIIYVDQFDENLWKGFPIIEPTKRMRAYAKP